MANSDSEREPSDNQRKPKVSGTAYDLGLFLLTVGTLLFALGVIVSAILRQYPFTVVYAVLAVLFAYLLYHFGRKRRRPIGLDFNI
jgi:hypothetical protein